MRADRKTDLARIVCAARQENMASLPMSERLLRQLHWAKLICDCFGWEEARDCIHGLCGSFKARANEL